jgi:two-component system, OmpR family, phosphate regulon response regulator PhoB
MRKLPRILVVEDEPAIAELIAVNLRHNGFQPIWVADGEGAQREINEVLPDAILLDWMLPGQSGIALARKWRADPRIKPVPILMIARIRAVLRRRAPEQVADSVTIGSLHLDAATHRVTFEDRLLKLGPTEYKLLHYLMKHAERVHSRGQLLDKVWGDHVYIEERTVDVHVKRLREALGEAGVMVETVRGVGYRLTALTQPQPN